MNTVNCCGGVAVLLGAIVCLSCGAGESQFGAPTADSAADPAADPAVVVQPALTQPVPVSADDVLPIADDQQVAEVAAVAAPPVEMQQPILISTEPVVEVEDPAAEECVSA